MSLFKEAIREIVSRPLTPPKLRNEPVVHAASAQIIGGDGMDRQRDGKDYDKIAGDLSARLAVGVDLTNRELRDAAWCLWQTGTPLADAGVTLLGALRGIEDCTRKQPGRALASSFLYFFDPERAGMPEASATLCRIAERLGRPWAELQVEYALLDWRTGPPNVAGRALELRKSPTEVLAQGGLRTQDALSGYVQACAGELLRKLVDVKDISPAVRLSLVQGIALDGKRKLIFEPHGPLVANALVLPFAAAMPAKDVRDTYLSLLLDLFKDPRLPGNAWGGMPAAREIVRRWLTEQSLRQFLDIVDEVALERMWVYRRAFWEAIYRADLISEAWVVFDASGARAARRAFGKEVSFATFDGSVQSGHAVLLLRVGRGVVAEWSYNGKCHIWNDAEDRTAPRLYRRAYVPDTVRSYGSDSIHHSTFAVTHWPHDGANSWQSKVASKLHQMTGVRIPASSYKVKG